MRFAETALGMEECVTAYAKVNTSSANVLHKLGFTDEAVIPYECSGGDMITEGILCRYKRIQVSGDVPCREYRIGENKAAQRKMRMRFSGFEH